jgi:pimeloyl-ACP methyl ester carboxylesterase
MSSKDGAVTEEQIRPFHLAVPQADLDDLNDRLDRTRWPDQLQGVGWRYGVPVDYLRELAEYWRHSYDWRAAEAQLNAWPQFVTTIDGANLHFAHIRSPEPNAMPLVMTHGWPGSIVEFDAVAGPLTDPRTYGGDSADAFHLVLPSIPGYGLSGPTCESGWDYRRVARAVAGLMDRLDYEKYGAQGGDWGSAISRELGLLNPDRVIGVHLNMVPGAQVTREPTAQALAALDAPERERWLASWRRSQLWSRDQDGYRAIQSTRPQTLAYALTDSPIGQLAWIVEKFKEWTDSSERPEDAINRDHLLTNVMLYWLTGTAGSSARLYYEDAHTAHDKAQRSTVPTAVADFPAEIQIPLRHRAQRMNNIVRWTSFKHGGHFAAMEQAHALVTDLRDFFRLLR